MLVSAPIDEAAKLWAVAEGRDVEEFAFRMELGCWYADSAKEHRFIAEEQLRGSTRFAVALFLLDVVGIWYMTRMPESELRTVITVACATNLLALIAEGVLWFLKRLKLQALESSSDNVGYTAGVARSLQHGIAAENLIIRCARIHEGIVMFSSLITTIAASLFYRLMQTKCAYFVHHDANAEDHTDCPYQIYAHWFFLITLFSHVISQPRFFFVCVGYLAAFITLLGALRLHDTTFISKVLIYVFCAVFLVFAALLKYVSEQQHRLRFQQQERLETRRRVTVARTESLKEFVLSITPAHLHSRLVSHTNTIEVDVSEHAVCVVVHLRNIAKFMHHTLPSTAAFHVGLFRVHTEKLCTNHKFHQIRSLGDAMFVVSNLFQSDHESTQLAVSEAMGLVASLAPPKIEGCRLDVCCGIASGHLTGMPLGTTCIRYDIFGPALQEAHGLALMCTPEQFVNVAHDLAEMLSETGGIHILQHEDQSSFEPPLETPQYIVAETSESGTESQSTAGHPESAGEMAISGQMIDFDVLGCVDNEANSATAIAGGAILKVKTSVKAAGADLSTTTECWCVSRFSSPHTQQLAASRRRANNTRSFTICCASCAVLVALLLVIGITDSSAHLPSERLIAGIVLLVLACVGLMSVALHALVRHNSITPIHVWHQLVAFVMFVVAMVASAVMRPTIAGDGNGALCFIFSLALLFIGGGVRSTLCGIMTMFVASCCIELLVLPRFPRSSLLYIPFAIIYLNAALVCNRLNIALFSSTIRAQEALNEVEMHEHIRNAVQASIVPPQLKISQEQLKKRQIKVWSEDEVVAIVLSVSNVGDQHTSSSEALSLHRAVEARMVLIEDAVRSCPNQSLAIVNVFGGNVAIAGPFDAPEAKSKNPALPAITDAVHMMASLLHASSPSEGGNLRFGAGIAIELGFHVLTTTTFPTFDLMGPCINTARTLVVAAPAEMAVVTDKFAEIYERECDSVGSDRIALGPPETWRLRDVGSIRVRRITKS